MLSGGGGRNPRSGPNLYMNKMRSCGKKLLESHVCVGLLDEFPKFALAMEVQSLNASSVTET